jgi:branched-chain amino acid transport system substrate-binding protein
MMPRFAGLTLAAAVLLSACSPLPTPKQEVKIGSEVIVGVPLAATGSQATEGTLTRQGYDLWADWANRDGGILIQGVKHPIRLVYEDDASRPDLSAQAAEKLITTEKAAFLLGPYGTTNSAAVAAVADRHHVPMMAANGAAHQLYTQGWRYLFGVIASADQYPEAVIHMALGLTPRPATLAILTADDASSLAITKGAIDYATSQGQQIVYFKQYKSGTTNLYDLVQQAKEKNPDIFVNSGHLLEAIAAHKAAKDLRLDAKMFAYAIGPAQPEFVQSLGSSADFVVTASPWTPQARYKASYYLSGPQYVAAYRKKNSTQLEPTYLSAAATASGVVLQLAMEKAQSMDAEKVRSALSSVDTNTFFGRIKFDAGGQNSYKNVLVEQIQSGQIQTVYPPEVAATTPQYPTPTWTARYGAPPQPPKAKLPGTGVPPSSP